MKLNLPHAARRLYTMDGEQVTSMQQLLKPYYPELTYLRGFQNQLPANSISTGVRVQWYFFTVMIITIIIFLIELTYLCCFQTKDHLAVTQTRYDSLVIQ